ncbi:MAG: hypothetical protein JRN28_03445 [Nitrososphaerota archaeon]|nr:hypothetical protein [Nitrososphaerota archaeon]
MSAPNPSLIRHLNAYPPRKAISWVSAFIAVANLLDLLTTLVGFSLGLVEKGKLSVFALDFLGINGLVAFRVGNAVIFALLAYASWRRTCLDSVGGQMLFIVLLVWLVVSFVPVLNNLLFL